MTEHSLSSVNQPRDVLDELREYDPDVSEVYVIDRAIAEIERLRDLIRHAVHVMAERGALYDRCKNCVALADAAKDASDG